MADLDVFRDEFVPNVQSFNRLSYSSWKSSNPAEAAKWESYRDGIIAGQSPSPPALATKFGKALVAGGKLVQPAAAPSPPSPSPLPPPSASTQIPANGIITSGGTYTGSRTGQVQINTNAPVTIQSANITNTSGSTVVAVQFGPTNVTLDHCFITGGTSIAGPPGSQRAFVAEGFQSVVIRNCTFENGCGIELDNPASGTSTVLVTKNIYHNVVGDSTGGTIVQLGNFVRLLSVFPSSFGQVEISWNQNINDYNKSMPEDVLSFIHVSNIWAHDNYIQGQYALNNTAGSSQNTITLESPITGCVIERNQCVNTGGGIYPSGGSSNGRFDSNRVVSSGYIWGTNTRMANGYEGMYIGGTNNTAANNVLGYVGKDGRVDGEFPGAAESGTVHLPDPIDHAKELAEWTFWQNKLAANGITVGAA